MQGHLGSGAGCSNTGTVTRHDWLRMLQHYNILHAAVQQPCSTGLQRKDQHSRQLFYCCMLHASGGGIGRCTPCVLSSTGDAGQGRDGDHQVQGLI